MRELGFIGDTHFENEDLRCKLLNYQNMNFIHVGDFNLGCKPFYDEEKWLNILNNTLIETNSMMYIIAGNHDDPNYFTNDLEQLKEYFKTKKYNCFNYKNFSGDEYRKDPIEYAEYIFNLSNIKIVPNYTVLDLCDKKILCVGGAISINRLEYIKHGWENIKYYKNENFYYDYNKIANLRDIDIVVTHSSPNFCEPTAFNDIVYHYYNSGDLNLLKDLDHERHDIKLMHDVLISNNDIKHWFNGHFHNPYSQMIGNILFKTVGILEIIKL